MSRNRASQTGFTVVELLSVVAVLALIMSAVALIIGPLLHSQSRTQAKVDTVQAAAMALYRIERDIRNSRTDAVFTCTTAASPTCSPLVATPVDTSALVVSTAFSNGTGQFQVASSTGKPNWQGATVYWIDSVGNLDLAFDEPTGDGATVGTSLNALQAADAVKDVTDRGGMQLARFVEQLSVGLPSPTAQMVSLQLQAQSTVDGAANETTYQTEVEARN